MSLKPRMYNNQDGDLFIEIELDKLNETLQVPQFNNTDEFYSWVNDVVPKMIESLNARKRAGETNNILKFRSNNVRKAIKKYTKDLNKDNTRSIRRAKTSPDGPSGV